MLDAYTTLWPADQSGWSIGYLWRSMDWLGRAVVSLLALMLADTVVIFCDRFYRYSVACRHSRAFVRDAAAALRDGNFDGVMTSVARNGQSHVATVVAAGFTAFASAPPQVTDMEPISAAERALRRIAKLLSAELKLGLGTLATISSSAPFIGLMGTLFGIMHSFRGVGMERATWMAMVTSSLAEALVTTAMGLLVAVFAVWCRNYLCNRVEVFESEMSNATLEAVTYLNAHGQWRNQRQHSEVGTKSSVFDTSTSGVPRSWEVPYDRPRVLLLAVWLGAFYLACVFGWAMWRHWSYVRKPDHENSSEWVQIGGQEVVSPDRRFRAVVPMFYREKLYSPGRDGYPRWSCAGNSEVALRIVPNDRPRAWIRYRCDETQTKYVLEPDEALLTWNCSVPVAAWRTDDELLVQCRDCSDDNLQLVKPSFFPERIVVLGPDGKRIHPQVVHPQPRCFD